MSKNIVGWLVVIVIIVFAISLGFNKYGEQMAQPEVSQSPMPASPQPPVKTITPAKKPVVAPVTSTAPVKTTATVVLNPLISKVTPTSLQASNNNNNTITITGVGFSASKEAGRSNTVTLDDPRKIGTVVIAEVYANPTGTVITLSLPISMYTGKYNVIVKNQLTGKTSNSFSYITVSGNAVDSQY